MDDNSNRTDNHEDKNNPKNGDFLSRFTKYGVYVILVLCIAGIAIASAYIVPGRESKLPDVSRSDTADATDTNSDGKSVQSQETNDVSVASGKDESVSDLQSTLDPLTGKPVLQEGKKNASVTPAPDFTPAPTDAPVETKLLNPPVAGEIIWKFAMNELIYSKTLDQWTTHSGVDIACKLGGSVHAVADGVIESVYTDDAFGITVVIAHENGHKSVYSNLSDEDLTAKEGASVKANDTIGKCGNTAVFECEGKSHIHFEYHVDSKPVDPTLYVYIQVQSSEA